MSDPRLRRTLFQGYGSAIGLERDRAGDRCDGLSEGSRRRHILVPDATDQLASPDPGAGGGRAFLDLDHNDAGMGRVQNVGTEGLVLEYTRIIDAQAAPWLRPVGGDDFPVDRVLGQDDAALDDLPCTADLELDGVTRGIGIDREE